MDHYPLMTVPAAPGNGGPLVPPGTPSPFVPQPSPNRFVKRGDSMVCLTCNLDARYCKGHANPSPSPPDGDGDASDLSKRIRELRGRDGR